MICRDNGNTAISSVSTLTAAVNGALEDEAAGRPLTRKRAIKACTLCNQKKTKCERPVEGEVGRIGACKSCLESNTECIFPERKKRGPKKLADSTAASAGQSSHTTDSVNSISSSSFATISQVSSHLKVQVEFKPKSYIGTVHVDESVVLTSRYDNIVGWKHFDFYCSQIQDQKGGSLAFLDYYFKYVYIEIPIFSKICLENHLTDLPIWLLHTMYACCFITPLSASATLTERAFKHMRYAMKSLHEDLEGVDPFYCCALIHAATFYSKLGSSSWISHLTLAVQIAYQLGMDKDFDLIWYSINGKRLQSIDMLRGIWIMIFFLDYYTQFSAKQPMIIKGSLDTKIVVKYVPVNSNHPTNIPENFLTYYKYQLPLIELSKRKLILESRAEYLSFDTAETLLEEFDEWFFTYLPSTFRYSTSNTIWKSRFTCMLNLLYLSNKIDILVPFFISYLEGENGSSSKYFADTIDSLAIVTVICRSYIDYKSHGGLEEPLQNSSLLGDTVFRATLILIACLSKKRCEEEILFEEEIRISSSYLLGCVSDHMRLLLYTPLPTSGGDRVDILREYLERPDKAIAYLKTGVH